MADGAVPLPLPQRALDRRVARRHGAAPGPQEPGDRRACGCAVLTTRARTTSKLLYRTAAGRLHSKAAVYRFLKRVFTPCCRSTGGGRHLAASSWHRGWRAGVSCSTPGPENGPCQGWKYIGCDSNLTAFVLAEQLSAGERRQKIVSSTPNSGALACAQGASPWRQTRFPPCCLAACQQSHCPPCWLAALRRVKSLQSLQRRSRICTTPAASQRRPAARTFPGMPSPPLPLCVHGLSRVRSQAAQAPGLLTPGTRCRSSPSAPSVPVPVFL